MATRIRSGVRDDPSDRLTDQARSFIELHGMDRLTIRSLAEATGIPAATIQYQFGSKERLLVEALARLVERRIAWLDGIAGMLPDRFDGMRSIAHLLPHVLALGGREERLGQLALLDLAAAALRRPSLMAVLEPWSLRLEAFWRDVAGRAGAEPHLAGFLVELHLGLMLHLTGIEPAIEGQALADEIVDRALSPAGGRGDFPWFRKLLGDALAAPMVAADIRAADTVNAQAIVDAAKQIVVKEGPTTLSFRSVAARAKTSVSAIAHYFPTRQSLVYAAYRAIHDELIVFTRGTGLKSYQSYVPSLADDIVGYSADGGVPLFVAFSEFELVAARHPDFADIARYARMTRGLYHTHRPDEPFDIFGRDAFDSFALSFWILGYALRMKLPRSAPADGVKGEGIAYGFRQFGLV